MIALFALAWDYRRVAVDEPFTVGGQRLMTPGDTSHGASGWNIYNCRCCVRAVVKGHGRKRETYAEWLEKQNNSEQKHVEHYRKNAIIESWAEPKKESAVTAPVVDLAKVYQDAKDGTRHAGVYRDAANKSKPRLIKSIRSHEEQVKLHADKIAHPEKYDANWASKTDKEKEGLLRKWRKDVQRNAEQAAVEKETYKERFGEEP